MIRMIKESDDKMARLVGKDFYTAILYLKDDGWEVTELGDVDELSEGYVIISNNNRQHYKITYEWLWNDNSNEFEKSYYSGKILTVREAY